MNWKCFFGAKGQIAVGIVVTGATIFQAVWWGFVDGPPGTTAIYWLSVEALLFAAYGIIATGLGYRATERVETAVVENIEEADQVNVGGGDTK